MKITYPKNRIDPILKKHEIDIEKNSFIRKILEIFNGKNEYQIWIVTLCINYERLPIQNIKEIALWINENKQAINSLTKHNIVNYKTRDDFQLLLDETRGLTDIKKVKKFISEFNTKQRNFMNDMLDINSVNGYNCHINHEFEALYDFADKFYELSKESRKNIITVSSGLNNKKSFFSFLSKIDFPSYSWNKESVKEFIKNNVADTDIVFESKNGLIVNTKTYKGAEKIGGHGHTQWCFSVGGKEGKDRWEVYVSLNKKEQYFIFNFDVPENNSMAHVGFTVDKKNGITDAHDTCNTPILSKTDTEESYIKYDIFDCLEDIGANASMFIDSKINKKINRINKMLSDNIPIFKNEESVLYGDIKKSDIGKIMKMTFINNQFILKTNKYFIALNKKKCKLCLITVFKDDLGFEEIRSMVTEEGKVINISELYNIFGITIGAIISNRNIPIENYIFKNINDGRENNAINIINSYEGKIDDTVTYNGQTLAMSALRGYMFDLLNVMVSRHICVNMCASEPLLHSLLYLYDNLGNDLIEYNEILKEIISKVIIETDSLKYTDVNGDTPLMISACYEKSNWATKLMIETGKDLNINCMNDIGYTALGNSIRKKNSLAAEYISEIDGIVLDNEYSDTLITAKKYH